MRVVLRTRHGDVDVEVVVHDPTASVADLAVALPRDHCDGDAALEVDGVPVAGSVGLRECGLHPGSEVGRASAGPARKKTQAAAYPLELRVVGGLVAGDRCPLPPGRSVVGRDPSCDVVLSARTTSGRHAALVVEPTGAVTLTDVGSASGTWLEGQRLNATTPVLPGQLAGLAAVLVQVAPPSWREPALLGRLEADGRRALRRSPRPAPLPTALPVTPPPTDARPPDVPRFGWAAALVPLAGGLVLARFVDPRLALFTLLGPAVLIGQWIEERRRHRRAGVGSRVDGAARLATFSSELEEAGAVEVQRRRCTHPDAAAVGDEVEALGAGLWARRTGHPAFAEVSVGDAPALRWDPPTTKPAEGPAVGLLAEARLPHGCPALVQLGPGHHVGLAGPRDATLAVARWVVLQLAAHHGPADLRLAVTCAAGNEGDWSWAAFLPHTESRGSSGRRLLGGGPAQAEEVADLMAADGGPHAVVVVDSEGSAGGEIPVGGPLADGPSTLTIGPSRRGLPSRCTSVLELDGPDGWGRLASGGADPEPLLAAGVTTSTARRWARRLAAITDPEGATGAAALPASVRLLDLLGLQEPTGQAVLRRWDGAGRRGLAVPIGSTGGRDGPEPVQLDLVADGPHALVAGTTGAGKSELLRSLVAGLASSSPPDRLALLLVDYKGGAAFAEAARLPHVLGVVTDLGPDEAERALRSLEAELRRREAVLAELGLRDLAAHPGHAEGPMPPGVEPLPRIVVVVDELAALVTELPSFLDGLVQLAARGRSLGLHLVLGTQRPGGVVSAAVRANCALRCCLRVPDEVDAVDVVGSTAPAHLDRRQPGRAFVRRGARDLVEVQVGLVGGRRTPDPPPVTVVPAGFGPNPAQWSDAPGAADSDLAGLVVACRCAADEAGMAVPRQLWLPPLPAALNGVDLPTSDELAIGLLDDPDHQRQLVLSWRPTDGPMLAIGSGRGPAAALRAGAAALAARLGPSHLHVYGLDLGAQGLAPLAELPHLGALVRPGEHERLHRLIRLLADELAARQSVGVRTAGEPGGPPLVLVLVDGIAALRGALDGSGGMAALDALERVVADGAALGLVVAATADRPASVPAAWSAAASRRLAFRFGDPLDLLSLGGTRVDQSRWPEGRCLDITSGLVAQVATGEWPPPSQRATDDSVAGPAPVRVLPALVALEDVLAGCPPGAGPEGLRLPLGIDGRDLGVALALLRPGQPFVVCGPPGSGRTTALAALSRAAEAAGCTATGAGPGLADRLVDRACSDPRPPLVVVVDDADRTDDADGALAALATGRHAFAHLFAAVPPEALRSAFGHWTADLRRSGAGLVLRPRSDLDGDVLGIPLLPRWPMSLTGPGRGVIVADGEAVPVQVATS